MCQCSPLILSFFLQKERELPVGKTAQFSSQIKLFDYDGGSWNSPQKDWPHQLCD